LSIEEVVKYLGDGNLARPKMSPEEKKFWDVRIYESKGVPDWFKQIGYPNQSFFIDFHGNPKRVARDADGETCWWWLRSPGRYDDYAARVHGDGDVYVYGDRVTLDSGGVRPALWLNL
jgi:hypothetical protein